MHVQALNDKWTFRASDEEVWYPAKVPGCVHTDLLANGLIPNPFYGTNETGLQWIDKKDWEYAGEFDVTEEVLADYAVELVFEGLDTYADVYVNGKRVLFADNMFRTWRVNVKELLRIGPNSVNIRFRSPIKEDLPKLEALGYGLPAPNDQSEAGGLGDKKLSVFARKAPYHYGWDWGPRFVTSGIWREVRLESWSGVRITDLFIRQNHVEASTAKLTALVEIEAESAYEGILRLTADERHWDKEIRVLIGKQVLDLELELDNPALWWCRGMGEAHLYNFRAAIYCEGKCAVSREIRTGLRSVRMVKEKDAYGASFYVELNGKPVFAKGANHIPNDSFVTEVSPDRYRHEIRTAVQSNMNMLRVWGGGIYESDEFYELCDEYGIMVWQDFMFACSMYPGDEHFLNSVEREAADNIVRLRNHPSIVLWCGNNEMDSAWAHFNENAGWGWKQNYTPEQREKIWADYEAVFHRILPDAVNRYAPDVEYWPSSPITGLTGTADQHTNPSSTSGDIHYWGVWHMGEPFENFNVYVGRFMSEYGFQSFPELDSVLRYAEEKDLELESEVMTAHQKNGQGNRIIKEYMERYLSQPKDFPSFLYLSQVLQADAMKMAIEAHRRRKPYCMGTLYWQMNDCWPVASWAGMDYYGKWKALQYEARRCFQDLILSVDSSTGGYVNIHLVSDLAKPISGDLHVSLYDFKGNVLEERNIPAAVGANTAAIAASFSLQELIGSRNPHVILMSVALMSRGGVLADKLHYFTDTKSLKLGPAAITVKQAEGEAIAGIMLEADVLAKHVQLKAEAEGIFSDNFFDLIPGVPKLVQFLVPSEDGSRYIPGSPGRVEVSSMADYIAKETAG